jgi:hypothetical protein
MLLIFRGLSYGQIILILFNPVRVDSNDEIILVSKSENDSVIINAKEGGYFTHCAKSKDVQIEVFSNNILKQEIAFKITSDTTTLILNPDSQTRRSDEFYRLESPTNKVFLPFEILEGNKTKLLRIWPAGCK